MQDIEDPQHPSLEEEKQRRIAEKKEKSVEEKKLHVQRNLASMKTLFRTLRQR